MLTISVSGAEHFQPNSDVVKHHDTGLSGSCEEWLCRSGYYCHRQLVSVIHIKSDSVNLDITVIEGWGKCDPYPYKKVILSIWITQS